MAWSLMEAVGSDRYLTLEECPESTSPLAQDAWDLYQSGFGGYCETRLDPLFHRLEHPATSAGRLLANAAPVLVVGTGPSLAASATDLRRLRNRMRVATSPRGAEALRDLEIVPDLVFVEHRTALDAHHTARYWRDGRTNVLQSVPLIAADWRTPRSWSKAWGRASSSPTACRPGAPGRRRWWRCCCRPVLRASACWASTSAHGGGRPGRSRRFPGCWSSSPGGVRPRRSIAA